METKKFKKIISGGILAVFLLTSCTNGEMAKKIVETKSEKADFFIETKKISDFSQTAFFKKTGRLTSKEDIEIKAQASGKIEAINFEEGQIVNKGEEVVSLEDTYLHYQLSLEQADNAVKRANLDYDKQKINLEKVVKDARVALEKAQNDYDIMQRNVTEDTKQAEITFTNTKKNIEENLKQAEKQLEDTALDKDYSVSNLNLETIKKSYQNAKLNYNNLLQSNLDTVKSYQKSLEVYHLTLKNLYDDVVLFADQLLGVTDKNKSYNDNFDKYLGVKNSVNKNDAENKLEELILLDAELKTMEDGFVDLSAEKLLLKIEEFDQYFIEMSSFLEILGQVIEDSVVSYSLTQLTIDWYLATNNGFQTSQQSSYSAFVSSLKNPANSFLNNYQNSEQFTLEGVSLLENQIRLLEEQLKSSSFNAQVSYSKTQISNDGALTNAEVALEKTKIANDNSLKNAEIALTNANNNLTNAKDNLKTGLLSLKNVIKSAELSYLLAFQEVEKLKITSPITGEISQILVDQGQEVNVGTPIFKMISSLKQEVEIGLNDKELAFVQVGSQVDLIYKDKELQGEIISISKNADQYLNYKTKIKVLTENISLLGDFIEVKIPVTIENNFLLPLNIITSQNNGQGSFYVLEDKKPMIVTFQIVRIWRDQVEVIFNQEKYPNWQKMKVILSDLKNYDATKSKLKVVE